jgi:hypothetical protein
VIPFAVSPVFHGETVAVIGGGPSLTLDQMRRVNRARMLGRLRILAVNDAAFVAASDWVHACDARWWSWHGAALACCRAIKTTADADTLDALVDGHLVDTGRSGFDADPSCIRTGGSSVYQGMHIAIHAGARRILLVGVDMRRGEAGETHWHAGHGTRTPDYASAMLPHFATLLPALAERRVEVVNCSPGSALDCFPTGDLRDHV